MVLIRGWAAQLVESLCSIREALESVEPCVARAGSSGLDPHDHINQARWHTLVVPALGR